MANRHLLGDAFRHRSYHPSVYMIGSKCSPSTSVETKCKNFTKHTKKLLKSTLLRLRRSKNWAGFGQAIVENNHWVILSFIKPHAFGARAAGHKLTNWPKICGPNTKHRPNRAKSMQKPIIVHLSSDLTTDSNIFLIFSPFGRRYLDPKKHTLNTFSGGIRMSRV